MRLGKHKNICIRIFPAHTRTQWKRTNNLLVVWLVILIVSVALAAFGRRVATVVVSVAERHATDMAVRMIHEVVDEQMQENGFSYADFVNVTTDASGKIQAIAVNPKTVNRLKSGIILAVEQKVNAQKHTSVQIPYVAFFSDYLAVGRGPCVEVELSPSGYCLVDFESSFSAAGINQTKHQIDIVIQAEFSMMTAVAGEGITVETVVPVAQTVIVGTVPNSYFEIQK